MNTLPSTSNVDTSLAKSTPMTQASQMLTSQMIPSDRRDILEPLSNEQARAAYLTKQIQGMRSVKLPSDMPSLEDMLNSFANLSKRIQTFCQEWKAKKSYEWESLKLALKKMKKSKEKCCEQQAQEEKDVIYAQMVQNLEKTRTMVRNSVSRASTISAEECQLTLTEEDFMTIQRKMNKIDQRLDELHKNWHAEYRDAESTEDCEIIKRFYKPYLEKYESKYRILYHLLHQSMLFPTQDPTSKITPSLVALDNAQALRRIRNEPGEDTPQWYSPTSEHLTPTSLKHQDTRLDPSLHVTPVGLLSELPTAINTEEARERGCQMPEEKIQETSCETSVKETSDTHLKLIPESNMREAPRRFQSTREASREDAIALTQHFFATVHERSRGVNVEGPIVTSLK